MGAMWFKAKMLEFRIKDFWFGLHPRAYYPFPLLWQNQNLRLLKARRVPAAVRTPSRPFQTQWLLYDRRTICVNAKQCVLCQLVCSVWISEQTAIISRYRINWLVCITETECVYCAVRTGSLNVIQLALVLTGSSKASINTEALQLVFILILLFPEAEAREKWVPSEKLVPLSDIPQHWTEKYFHRNAKSFQKSRSHLRIQSPRRVMLIKFRTNIIYLLTATGSSTVHNYTQTIPLHRTKHSRHSNKASSICVPLISTLFLDIQVLISRSPSDGVHHYHHRHH